jgi:hypothetical protein
VMAGPRVNLHDHLSRPEVRDQLERQALSSDASP